MNQNLKNFIDMAGWEGFVDAVRDYKMGADPELDVLVPQAKQLMEEIGNRVDYILTDSDDFIDQGDEDEMA